MREGWSFRVTPHFSSKMSQRTMGVGTPKPVGCSCPPTPCYTLSFMEPKASLGLDCLSAALGMHLSSQKSSLLCPFRGKAVVSGWAHSGKCGLADANAAGRSQGVLPSGPRLIDADDYS